MTDESLQTLLKSAMPPTADDGPSRDVWRDVVTRIDGTPRWSLLDLGLAAAVAIALILFPEGFWLLAYHL
jgi:hypothetical protein